MAHIRVVSGHGRYSDPWHDFAATSTAIARIVDAQGHAVHVVPDEPSSLENLNGLDLLIVNTGGNPEVEIAPDDHWTQAQHGLGEWINAGGRVLGVHTAANSFPDWPQWTQLLGGSWVRGTSWHPQRSVAVFEPTPEASSHPVWTGLNAVTCYDERYSDMEVLATSQPLVRHELDEEWQIMGWAASDTVIYDAMGHGERSYSAPSRARFLVNEVDWLLR